MEESELRQHLEQMQFQLYRLVEQKGSFVHPKVVELSQQIDRLVLTMQQMRMKSKTK